MKKYIIFIVGLLGLPFLISGLNHAYMKKVEVGDTIPSFELKDQNGNLFVVNSAINKPLVIYFYPKDDTPGCVKEACKFRDDFEKFNQVNALVIGISSDNVASHKKFEEKYNLPIILLADINNNVRKLFGVPKSMIFLPGRVTYVVDKSGIVKYIFNSQFKAEKHVDKSLEILKGL
ncbi:peroxiredoxin [Lutibacter sp.]